MVNPLFSADFCPYAQSNVERCSLLVNKEPDICLPRCESCWFTPGSPAQAIKPPWPSKTCKTNAVAALVCSLACHQSVSCCPSYCMKQPAQYGNFPMPLFIYLSLARAACLALPRMSLIPTTAVRPIVQTIQRPVPLCLVIRNFPSSTMAL